jgi:hypothetical protein
MKIIPFEKLVIKTLLSPKAVIVGLKNHVEPEGLIHSKKHQIFEGKVGENSFCINRIISGIRNVDPIIFEGTVNFDGGETLVRVRVRPHYGWLMFMVFSLLIFSLVGIHLLLNRDLQGCIFLLLPWGVCFWFLLTSRWADSKVKLTKIVQGLNPHETNGT